MKSTFTFFFSILFCISFAQIPAGYKPIKDTATFKTQMSTQSKLINSIQSDFTQEKYLSVMSEKVVSKGHFLFKKVNMFLWEYYSPNKYIVAINKDKILIKENDKVKKYDMAANRMFKGINDLMMATVQGTLLNNKEYKASFYEGDAYFLIELAPVKKTMKSFLKVIQLYVNKKDYAVEKVKMIEPGDDYTTIDFSNRKTNEAIADEKFTVK